jgi:rubrerythrin
MNFTHWKNHFIGNRNHFDHIDWKNSYQLDQKEKKAVASSIQQFQKGESSEGYNLILSAKTFAQKENDHSYVDAIKAFIKEEQSHAAALLKFMDTQQIATIEDHWIDKIFRKLRKGKNLERAIMILSCAEIIATEYYCALRDSTKSKTLRAICDQILKDEELHINFQAYGFYQIYKNRNVFANTLSRLTHFGLLAPSILVVYFSHHQVFRKSKMSIFQFTKGCVIEMIRLQARTLQHLTHESSHFINAESLHYESLI